MFHRFLQCNVIMTCMFYHIRWSGGFFFLLSLTCSYATVQFAVFYLLYHKLFRIWCVLFSTVLRSDVRVLYVQFLHFSRWIFFVLSSLLKKISVLMMTSVMNIKLYRRFHFVPCLPLHGYICLFGETTISWNELYTHTVQMHVQTHPLTVINVVWCY